MNSLCSTQKSLLVEFVSIVKQKRRSQQNITPFAKHFVRQPTLALLSLRELYEKECRMSNSFEMQINRRKTRLGSSRISHPQLYIFEVSQEERKNKLPIIPTCIMYGIYLAKSYTRDLDKKLFTRICDNKPIDTRANSKKTYDIQRVISIVQHIIKT